MHLGESVRLPPVKLAADGVAVVCADLLGAVETVTTVTTAGGKAVSKTIDVSKAADWELLVAEVTAELGASTT